MRIFSNKFDHYQFSIKNKCMKKNILNGIALVALFSMIIYLYIAVIILLKLKILTAIAQVLQNAISTSLLMMAL